METNNANMKIGQLIKTEVERQNIKVTDFAKMICCERANVYKIFERSSLDTAQLGLISKALNRNFFLDIAKNQQLSGVEDEAALREVADRVAVSQFVEVVPNILARLGIEPLLTFGRPLDIPKEIPLPEYFINPYNISFSVGELLFDKKNCNLSQTANVNRITDEESGLQVDLWTFKKGAQGLVNLKLDYKTEEQWEYAIRFVFRHFFGKYHIV